jgi:hypothetical protein
MHMAAHANCAGYAITAQDFFAELGITEQAPIKQSVGEARGKIAWEAFRYLLNEARQDGVEQPWNGHTVRIADGTKLNLPLCEETLERFDIPNSKTGACHYPQAWMVTLINSTSLQPIAAELGSYKDSERELMLKMMGYFDEGDVILLDRGLGGASIYLEFLRRGINFIHRVKTSGERVALYVQEFIKSNKATDIAAVPVRDDDGEDIVILVRLVKGPKDSEGKRIVFATSLLDKDVYTTASIRELYKSRWGIETMYGRLKNVLEIKKFHAKNFNGIMQEIYAHLLVLSLTALIENQASQKIGLDRSKAIPNFKAAVHVVRRHLMVIIGVKSLSRSAAKMAASRMIDEASKVLWRKQPGRRFPRVSHQPINVWTLAKKRKIAAFDAGKRGA